ncbi:hypothetical protein ABZY02_35155 [Streptomyces sp. NPDC006649]|uniref:hypothetical protein n=1 Tax=Streptomyces sp. NPDC006649 TaxID=3156896 RepID=UPI0033ADECBE
MSLFEVEAVMPSPRRPHCPLDDLSGPDLHAEFTHRAKAAASAAGKTTDEVLARLMRNFKLKTLKVADDHDLREAAREFQTWVANPAEYRTPAQRVRVPRPEGMAQLPLPRTTKKAAADLACSLCGEVVQRGAIIGRMKPPKSRDYVPMGWLCHHCLYTRRATPRRRDVLLRIFHHLFAATGVGVNAHEAQVLLDWIASDPQVTRCEAWLRDPLDTTVIRLRTSVEEEKWTTWMAVTSGITMLTALRDAPATEADTRLMNAILQHHEEWQTNPQNVDHRRYGTGIPYRHAVLTNTPSPTELSQRGGPFDLHQAPPPPMTEENDPPAEDTSL